MKDNLTLLALLCLTVFLLGGFSDEQINVLEKILLPFASALAGAGAIFALNTRKEKQTDERTKLENTFEAELLLKQNLVYVQHIRWNIDQVTTAINRSEAMEVYGRIKRDIGELKLLEPRIVTVARIRNLREPINFYSLNQAIHKLKDLGGQPRFMDSDLGDLDVVINRVCVQSNILMENMIGSFDDLSIEIKNEWVENITQSKRELRQTVTAFKKIRKEVS